MISSLTAIWPSVRTNGNRSSKASSRPPERRVRGTARCDAASARRYAMVSCSANASSNRNRCRPSLITDLSVGWWTARNADSRSITSAASRTRSGSGSSIPASESSASAAHSAIVQVRSLAVNG